MRREENLWAQMFERKPTETKRTQENHGVQCHKVSKDKHLIVVSKATDMSERMMMCRLEPRLGSRLSVILLGRYLWQGTGRKRLKLV